jgi:capsular polysaccharide biosynthesis protein/MinD-like ATPase involved in chromosome partitioning or flagellar assembly
VATTEGSLSGFLHAVRRGWPIVLPVALSVLIGATAYVETQPQQYDASAIVAIVPKPASPDPDLVRIAAPRYTSFITAPATIRQMAAKINEDPVDLRQRVTATLATDTGNITITVRQPSPDRAAMAANALAAHVRQRSLRDRLTTADIIAPAERPDAPSGPPRRLIEASALFVGLLLGVGLATVVNRAPRPGVHADPGLQRTGAPSLGGYPVVGRLPWSEQLESAASNALADVAVAEAAEMLRLNVAYELGGRADGVIFVTSPPGSHGKTVVATILSTVLVRHGNRVLLVGTHPDEAWMSRDPRSGGGLDDLLYRHPGPDETAEDAWISELMVLEEGLWVLPGWRADRAAAVPAGRLAAVLNRARELFDTIVVDGPSSLGNGVVRTLTWLADGVLIVISNPGGKTPLRASLRALLGEPPAPFVGVVVNQIRNTRAIVEWQARQLPGPRREP